MIRRWEEKQEKRRKENPLELTEEDRRRVNELVVGGKNRIDIARKVYDNHQAQGTEVLYGRTIRMFREYCEENKDKFCYEKFSEKEVLNFVIKAVEMDAGETFFATIKPALERLEELRGVRKEDSAITNLVEKYIKGGKKMAAQAGPPKKKKKAIPVEAIEEVLETYIWPYSMEIEKIDGKIFRTVFKWVIQACTLCRWDEYSRLRAMDFKKTEEEDGIIPIATQPQ